MLKFSTDSGKLTQVPAFESVIKKISNKGNNKNIKTRENLFNFTNFHQNSIENDTY